MMRIRSASCPKGAQRGAEGISRHKINHSRASPPQNRTQNTYSCKKRSENSERGNRIKDSPACTTNLGTGAGRDRLGARAKWSVQPPGSPASLPPTAQCVSYGAIQGVVHSRRKNNADHFEFSHLVLHFDGKFEKGPRKIKKYNPRKCGATKIRLLLRTIIIVG